MKVGEDFSQRFAEFVARLGFDDPKFEDELMAGAEEAFHWALDTHRERLAEQG